MSASTQFYIDGQWVEPSSPRLFDVVNPATEEVAGRGAYIGAVFRRTS
jgi:aldehyde dehydrogenase (NAD+)